jgi:putative ABC transport system permease protein
MFGNYLKSTLRFLERNKIFTGINILGLSLALGVSFVIVLYIVNELRYDHCHEKGARIFKVINHYKDFEQTIEGTPYVLAFT